MNSTKQTSKFTRFLKNNAALLLIIFCLVAICTVVLVVTLTNNSSELPDDNPVVKPTPGEDDDPVVKPTPDDPVPSTVKVYFQSPVNYVSVTMQYSEAVDVFNKTLNYWSTHKALDLSAADGTDVVSMYDGTVVDVYESYGMGNVVKIDHGENVVATYASLGDVQVVKGQEVARGEKIGTVSTTASYEFSDGAHLHLEVAKDGVAVDPTPYANGEVYREVEQSASQE